jgi:hypothetical protein
MSAQIDFRTLPACVPVLCIPRVYPNISESRIRRIFDDLNMGELERIDIISKHSAKPEEKFNRVFVHFRRWNHTENANIARERLLNGKEIKIIYDEPWFWKVSAYRESERKPPAPQNGGHRKPTIQFDTDEDRASNSRNVSSYRHQDDRRQEYNRPRHDDRPNTYNRYEPRPTHDEKPKVYNRYEQRPDNRPRPRQHDRRSETVSQCDKKPVHESTTPPCSPPKERQIENEEKRMHPPPPSRRKKKITLEVENKSEDLKENEDVKLVENM